MSTDPDHIRAEIDQTRSDLSKNVNALGDAITPSSVARRQADKVVDAASSLKDRVMGSSTARSDTSSRRGVAVEQAVGDARAKIADSAAGLGDKASAATDAAVRSAHGNPLAAGLIAVGIGWIAGSLLPASTKEREWGQVAAQKAQPAIDEVKSVVQDAAENLREPAGQAVAAVKDHAMESMETVRAEGQTATEDLRQSAVDSKNAVQESTS